MKRSEVLIIVIWFIVIIDSFMQGIGMPALGVRFFKNNIPEETKLVLLWFPFLFFLIAAFLQRKAINRSKLPIITKRIDNKFGPGTFDDFMRRLKPYLLFMTACLIGGGTGILSTYFGSQHESGYWISGFFLSGGVGLFSAYILSVKFPPRIF